MDITGCFSSGCWGQHHEHPHLELFECPYGIIVYPADAFLKGSLKNRAGCAPWFLTGMEWKLHAVIQTLILKTLHACKHHNINDLIVGGGVAANQAFMEAMKQACSKAKIQGISDPGIG